VPREPAVAEASWLGYPADPWPATEKGAARAGITRPSCAAPPLAQARQDLDAALDKFYITTRYPNGLPDGVPAEAYTVEEATDAIGKADSILEAVGQRLRVG
jgi:hypothetical protein